MSDKVKLIIEIPKEEYKRMTEESIFSTHVMINATQNGIPLDDALGKIRAKIEEKAHSDTNAIYRDGLLYALYIINKHTKDEEMSK